MTAVTASSTLTRPSTPGLGHRVLAVMRLQSANPWTTLIMPWLILAAILGLNISIWAIVTSSAGGRGALEVDAFHYNGGASFIVIYMLVMAVQAMSKTLRFALGVSITRRDYYMGTAVYFVALAVYYGAGFAVLAGVERATGGWGLDGHFFAPFVLWGLPVWQVGLVYALLLIAFLFLGAAVATMFVRWGATGVLVFFGALGVALVVTAWALTAWHGWDAVGRYFSGYTLGDHAALTLGIAAVSGLVAYALIRRATPRPVA